MDHLALSMALGFLSDRDQARSAAVSKLFYRLPVIGGCVKRSSKHQRQHIAPFSLEVYGDTTKAFFKACARSVKRLKIDTDIPPSFDFWPIIETYQKLVSLEVHFYNNNNPHHQQEKKKHRLPPTLRRLVVPFEGPFACHLLPPVMDYADIQLTTNNNLTTTFNNLCVRTSTIKYSGSSGFSVVNELTLHRCWHVGQPKENEEKKFLGRKLNITFPEKGVFEPEHLAFWASPALRAVTFEGFKVTQALVEVLPSTLRVLSIDSTQEEGEEFDLSHLFNLEMLVTIKGVRWTSKGALRVIRAWENGGFVFFKTKKS